MGKQVMLIEESDIDRFAKLVAEKVKEILKPQDSTVEKPISHKEAAAFLSITPDTLTRRIKSGEWPAKIIHMNGTRKAYYKSELKELLNRK